MADEEKVETMGSYNRVQGEAINIYNSPKQYLVTGTRRLPRIEDAVYRLYNPNEDNMHHWTANYEEANKLYGIYGWEYEGVAWYQGKGEATKRYYNPNNGDHIYTLDDVEAKTLFNLGWNSEGTDFKNYPGGLPVYRLYFPKSGQHMYTTDKTEIEDLEAKGWKNEGVKVWGQGAGSAKLSKAKMRALDNFLNITSIVLDKESSGVDISTTQDGSVKGYVDSSNVLHLWCAEKKIVPDDCKEMFNYCQSLTSIDALKNWDVSNVTSMTKMFHWCASLTSLEPLKNWDTSKVTSMQYMFYQCVTLTSLEPLKNWNVSNVTYTSCMFNHCESLTSLSGLENWDVSSMTDMGDPVNGGIFTRCYSLTSIDALKNWDVSNVTNMSFIFDDCTSLTLIEPLKNWDVSNVANMQSMFNGCASLASIDALENWDVSNVTNMGGMFMDCGHLASIEPLKNWDVSNVTRMNGMFYECRFLTSLSALENWDVSKADRKSMFKYISKSVARPSWANAYYEY